MTDMQSTGFDAPKGSLGRQYHIKVAPGEVGEVALMPGDPFRVQLVADRLDDAVELAHAREYRTVVGTYQGMRVTAMSTGIGCPSAAIAVEELARCGVHTFIRVGSTAALHSDIAVGDLIVNAGTFRNDGTSVAYAPLGYPAVPDTELTTALTQVRAGDRAVQGREGACRYQRLGRRVLRRGAGMAVSHDRARSAQRRDGELGRVHRRPPARTTRRNDLWRLRKPGDRRRSVRRRREHTARDRLGTQHRHCFGGGLPDEAPRVIGLRMNLHTHLEGWVRPSTAAELASSAGVAAPAQGWEVALRMAASGNLTQYLAHVAGAYPVLGSYEALARVTREAVEDAAADGTAFLELRAGPTTHVRDDFPLDGVVAAMCEGMADGVASTGMPTVLVLAMLREFDEDAALRLTEVAIRHRGDGVRAVDLAGDELRFPDLSPFVRAFATARDAGLGVTAHAAEAGEASAARSAHDLLGVDRIGHGSRVVLDRDVMSWAAATGLCFEVCPTSNVLTRRSAEPCGPSTAFDAGCRRPGRPRR
ncbi:MAG: hypothetical protein WKF73_07890 [Nocardioidaceae bacterium]